ncbi:flagellar brake domain-containing protein [uncultured Tyzzerella sp.]|uniref:flagellar brake protein n=1 Tax=uncultured Tyzzerella sp. TaxID=2321398 RepID=UPI00294261B0|nr:flagellar brake domain-containing protein [uncultured Tyzzerella sp.]
MDLFKKKKEKKEIGVINLKPGIPVEIGQISDKNLVNTHKSRLNDVLNDEEITILAPISNGSIVKLSHNTEYFIIFKTKEGILKSTIKVLSYDKKEQIPLIKIKLLKKMEKIQRRSSYRLRIGLDFEFDIVEDASDETLKDTDILLSKGRTFDISNGGIKFFSNENLEKGKYIKILINVEGIFVVAIGSIIYKEKISTDEEFKYSYRCRLENISEKYVEDLSRYIFEKQRDLSKKGRIFD